MTLLEGLISSVVMLIGLVGVVNGILFAARQNSVASKMTRAGAIANQVRQGLMQQGFSRLQDTDGMFSGCPSGSSLMNYNGTDLTDGVGSVSGFSSVCIVDVDAYDAGLGSSKASRVITPGYLSTGYATENQRIFKRVAVMMKNSGDKNVAVEIIVSWLDGGYRRYHHEFLAFYDPSAYGGMDQ